MEEDEWKVLSGCNACINSRVCSELGSCCLLVINAKYPEYTKVKRKMIQRIRTLCADNIKYWVETLKYKNMLKDTEDWNEWPEPEVTPNIWPGDHEGKYKQTKVLDRTPYKMKKKIPYGSREVIEPMVRTWDGLVKLTVIERMCIESLNKPR